jgi:hypothetical protein
MSLPSRAASSSNRWSGKPNFHNRFKAHNVAAQSLDPPANPAAIGMRLVNSMETRRRVPVTSLKSFAARTTKLSLPVGIGPGENSGGPAQQHDKWMSDGRSAADVADADRTGETEELSSVNRNVSYWPTVTMSVSSSWKPSGRFPRISRNKLSLAGV